jgi:PAP2 superfamily
VRNFIAIIRRCYSWKNIAWQVLAVVLTYFIVTSGFDWYWFTHTRSPLLQDWLFPAAIIGGLLPILLPITFFWVGKVRKSARATMLGYATMQAALAGLLISSFYKIFTGRIPPPFDSTNPLAVDISRQFNFGFLREGLFWGWPSSHTTVAFAVAVTLFILYKNRSLIKYGALLIALYIGIGVSTNIHWFSEFVAGVIIGSIIGVVVGRSFISTSDRMPG